MVSQPPQDTPFGLEPNVAAGIAYVIPLVGGIVMLVGGGTNRFVKWAAAQSITLWAAFILAHWLLGMLAVVGSIASLGLLLPIFLVVFLALRVLGLVAWLYTSITAFQGKEVRLPIIGDLTDRLFASVLTQQIK